MTKHEKDILYQIEEEVIFWLYRGIDKKHIADWLDDLIYDLSVDYSSELFNIIRRIQHNLLLGNEIINEFLRR